jgi:CRP-like cAMP-binding protein
MVIGASPRGVQTKVGMQMAWTLLEPLSEPDRHAVLARCRRQRYGRNEVVFREGDLGDSMHLLAKGTVAIRVSTARGDVATLDVLRAGDAFGEQALIGARSERSATVVALEPAEAMRLCREDFAALLVEHPQIAQLLIAILDARLRATSQNLVEALYLPADVRVYKRLARLAVLYEINDAGTIPITQDDLASMAGTTRQTANRVLHDLSNAEMIRLTRGKIEVLDAAKLARRTREH